MRAGLENWLQQTWYQTHRPPWFLRTLEPVYRTLFQHSQKKQSTKSEQFRSNQPLIVVGNITVGGSGKTPLVMHLCNLAKELNLRPGVASTGYGRVGNETILVGADSDARLCGDEPVMLAGRTGVPIIVARRRIEAIKKLSEMDVDVIFSDDGLQHSEIQGNIELCVVDGARGLGNGHLLPAGPLREPAGRLNKVDYVITNGVWAKRPEGLEVHVMQLEAQELRSLDNTKTIPVIQFRQTHKGKIIHAVAGIGNPQRFFDTLENLGIEAVPHRFPDHHPYTMGDMEPMTMDPAIIMTEKDAVKCRPLGLENAWYLPVETQLSSEFEGAFKAHLTDLTRERK
jgi:tetraacyldisaccharide 4'-kinase